MGLVSISSNRSSSPFTDAPSLATCDEYHNAQRVSREVPQDRIGSKGVISRLYSVHALGYRFFFFCFCVSIPFNYLRSSSSRLLFNIQRSIFRHIEKPETKPPTLLQFGQWPVRHGGGLGVGIGGMGAAYDGITHRSPSPRPLAAVDGDGVTSWGTSMLGTVPYRQRSGHRVRADRRTGHCLDLLRVVDGILHDLEEATASVKAVATGWVVI